MQCNVHNKPSRHNILKITYHNNSFSEDNNDVSWVQSHDGTTVSSALEVPCANCSGMYIGRVLYDGNLIPGKVNLSHKCIYIPYGNLILIFLAFSKYVVISDHKELKFDLYEVLTIKDPSDVKWIKSKNGKIDANAILGGYTDAGETLYIGRVVLHDGIIIPGKVHPSNGLLYISYNGKEVGYKKYELLIRV